VDKYLVSTPVFGKDAPVLSILPPSKQGKQNSEKIQRCIPVFKLEKFTPNGT
jgi:hypothetical protein